MNTADAILRTLESPNVSDSNMESANIVDVFDRVAKQMRKLSCAITPDDAMSGQDALGGNVGSLTEAVMGVTGGLVRIAESIDGLAEAVRENGGA